jgi:hypothetical protein
MRAYAVASAVAVAGMLAGAAAAADPTQVGGKPMKTDEPMKTGMMKPGMKVGDVKKAAEKRARELKPMMDKESASAKK